MTDLTDVAGVMIKIHNTQAFIRNQVAVEGPIKAVELASMYGAKVKLCNLVDNTGQFLQILGQMISLGEIVEVEYVLPHMSYRAKSMLFPKDTKITVNGNGSKEVDKAGI